MYYCEIRWGAQTHSGRGSSKRVAMQRAIAKLQAANPTTNIFNLMHLEVYR